MRNQSATDSQQQTVTIGGLAPSVNLLYQLPCPAHMPHPRWHDTLLHYYARCVKVAAAAGCRLAIVDNHAILGIVLQLVALEATLQHRRNVVRP